LRGDVGSDPDRRANIKEAVMRLLTAWIVIGPLVLIGGALPAAADQPASADTSIQLATGSGSSTDRDTYTQKARSDIRDWQQRLTAFGENAKAKGQQADNATENALTTAWARTQVSARRLQTATSEGWQSAKASYEKASDELADAWNRMRADDK
jgi:hypothetical protein